jgi:transaldolase
VISAWGKNVYAKLPATTTRGEPLFEAVRPLSHDGIKVNLKAIFAAEQAAIGVEATAGSAPACVSVFAGRLAGAGIDYRPIMHDAIARARQTTNVEIIWASTREVFSVPGAATPAPMPCRDFDADVSGRMPGLAFARSRAAFIHRGQTGTLAI